MNDLRLKIEDPSFCKINIKVGDRIQSQEIKSIRGYQSSVENIAHFGLGKEKSVDELIITWPDQTTYKLYKPFYPPM